MQDEEMSLEEEQAYTTLQLFVSYIALSSFENLPGERFYVSSAPIISREGELVGIWAGIFSGDLRFT